MGIQPVGRIRKSRPCPEVGEDECGAVGLEFEERAAIQSQGFDDLSLCRFDLGVHLIGRQIDKLGGDISHKAFELQPVVSCRGCRLGGLTHLVVRRRNDTRRPRLVGEITEDDADATGPTENR